jgi:PhoH-like ATPase
MASILDFSSFIAIPITVLEELDNFKKGNDTKNFSAREFFDTYWFKTSKGEKGQKIRQN